jgi:hypothetical protein
MAKERWLMMQGASGKSAGNTGQVCRSKPTAAQI